jgi:hypothetical protein
MPRESAAPWALSAVIRGGCACTFPGYQYGGIVVLSAFPGDWCGGVRGGVATQMDAAQAEAARAATETDRDAAIQTARQEGRLLDPVRLACGLVGSRDTVTAAAAAPRE